MDSKQNYHQEVEDGVNSQINNELSASYAYLAMVSSFMAYINFLLFSLTIAAALASPCPVLVHIS
jgi:xanthine dehydrogenase molybdopterin-binding subunit B